MARPRFPKIILLAEAQNWHCCYCGTLMVHNKPLQDDCLTTEHVIARTDGGLKAWENEVAACHLCNNGRGDLDAMAYYRMVQTVGRRKAAAMASIAHSRRATGAHLPFRQIPRWATLSDVWPRLTDGTPISPLIVTN